MLLVNCIPVVEGSGRGRVNPNFPDASSSTKHDRKFKGKEKRRVGFEKESSAIQEPLTHLPIQLIVADTDANRLHLRVVVQCVRTQLPTHPGFLETAKWHLIVKRIVIVNPNRSFRRWR